MSGQLFAAAADRNRHDLLPVLREWIGPGWRPRATVVELGSGTGQHAVHMAQHLPQLTWQPTEVDEALLRSVAGYVEEHRARAGRANLLPPLQLDIGRPAAWPELPALDAAVCINVIHIAPWAVAEGLFLGLGARLPVGGRLVTYGPYKVDGRCTTPSNEAFDASLRERDPSWGIRDLEAVVELAGRHGLRLLERRDTPINNFSLLFEAERGPAGAGSPDPLS